MKLTRLMKPRSANTVLCHPPTTLCLFLLPKTDIANRSLHHSPPLPPSRPSTASEAFSLTILGGPWLGIRSLLPSCLIALWCLFLGHPLLFLALLIMGLSSLIRLLGGIVFPLQNSISIFHLHHSILLLSGTVDSHPSENHALQHRLPTLPPQATSNLQGLF